MIRTRAVDASIQAVSPESIFTVDGVWANAGTAQRELVLLMFSDQSPKGDGFSFILVAKIKHKASKTKFSSIETS
jgi:hypothetical protein